MACVRAASAGGRALALPPLLAVQRQRPSASGLSHACRSAHAAPPEIIRRKCGSGSSSSEHRRRLPRIAAGDASSGAATASAPPAPPSAAPRQQQPYKLPHFAELPLDRAGALRKQQRQLEQMLADPRTLVLLLHRGRLLVAPGSTAAQGSSSSSGVMFGHPHPQQQQLSLHAKSFAEAGAQAPDGGPPCWLPLTASPAQLQPGGDDAESAAAAAPDYLFLGLDKSGAAVFAAQAPAHLLPVLPPTDGSSSATASGDGPRWVDVRGEGQHMAGQDAAVAALASGLLQWHSSAAFCSRTGAPTLPTSGGHARRPDAATAAGGRKPRSVYPRIDPAVIVAVGCHDWLLLGRKASWAEGRYSCLAGFSELGETLEQTVGREVLEESGVAVELSSVRYHSSQPWPFPASLMIGFTAEAASQAASLEQVASLGQAQGAQPTGGNAGSAGTGAGQEPGPPRGLQLLQGPAVVAALEVGLKPAEAERYLLPELPAVQVDPAELEDARWFHADWLAAATGISLTGSASDGSGSTRGAAAKAVAKGPLPTFRIPGRYALANHIISSWLLERQQLRAARIAAALDEGRATAAAALEALASVPDVCIDEGSFKYVLMRLSTADGLHSKLLVRGDNRAAYHNHVLQATAAEVRALAPDAGLHLETLGGGRIEHYPAQRAVAVFGYSAAFGQAPHHVTAALIRRWLPFHEVTESYEGY